MAKGFSFNTGNKWLDRYYGALYEIIDTYYRKVAANEPNISYSLLRQGLVTAKNEVNRSFQDPQVRKSVSLLGDSYFKSYYNNFDWFGSLKSQFSYGNYNVDVAQIARKWGFNIKRSSSRSAEAFSLTPSRAFGRFEGDPLIAPSPHIKSSFESDGISAYKASWQPSVTEFSPVVDYMRRCTVSGFQDSTSFDGKCFGLSADLPQIQDAFL